MKIIVTCGPSYEPIDQTRRLTNFSTGKLGTNLANFLTDAGHEVICLRGEGSTYTGELRAAKVLGFGTNDDLAAHFEAFRSAREIGAIFHAAALCDYRVERIFNEAGEAVSSPKIATREGRLQMILAPATKVLPQLRGWFPHTRIIGWKYELAGSRDDAFAKAWRQIEDSRTELCILNGAAYGPGFAICHASGRVEHCMDTVVLYRKLAGWLERTPNTEEAPKTPDAS